MRLENNGSRSLEAVVSGKTGHKPMIKSAARILFSSRVLLALAVLLVSAPAWATISACPAAATLLNASTPSPFPLVPGSATIGCTVGNLQFSNFNVGTDSAGATIDGILLGPNSTFSNGTIPDNTNPQITLSSAPGGYGIEFAGVPPNSPGVGCLPSLPNGTVQGYCISGGNLSLASDTTYTMTAINGTTFDFIILQASVSEHTSAGNANAANATVFREFCLGVATVTWGTNGQTACAAAGGTYGVVAVGTGFFGGHSNTYTPGAAGCDATTVAQPGCPTMFAATTVAAIRDTVYLTTPSTGQGSWSAVGSFDFITPEPATFSMIGGGFAGLGLMAWRRKRKTRS